jgi:K+-transporting ATPase KdpF subunit
MGNTLCVACREVWSARKHIRIPAGDVEPTMDAANLTGLILAFMLLLFLLVALTPPDTF